ncbi:RNA-directed DNA polymerase, eukaryota [Tanacetum coccineum]|uniref:RNA-directed DNA polymerase, eukaryota n=1 Tax=Tanacetum coccineum TaxID=301880 RepID=A0ABQ5AG92_9ASTR
MNLIHRRFPRLSLLLTSQTLYHPKKLETMFFTSTFGTVVANLDRLVENLCTIWIGRFHLYANRVRFERPPQNWSSKANHDQPPKPKARSHTGAPVGSTNTFASVLKEGLTSESVLVLDDSCIEEKDLSLSLMGKIKEVPAIPNLPTLIAKEGFQNVKLNYLGGMWVLFTFEAKTTYDKFQAHTGVRSWFSTIKQADTSFVNDERIVWISVEGLPIRAWSPTSFKKIASCWGELVDWEDTDQVSWSCKHLCLKTRMSIIINDRRKVILQGNAFWIRVKELDAWVPDFDEESEDETTSVEDEPNAINDQNNHEPNDDEDRVSESSFVQETDCENNAHEKDINSSNGNPGKEQSAENVPISDDPFQIYGLLDKQKRNSTSAHKSTDNSGPKFPPGFTPSPSVDCFNEVNLQDAGGRAQLLSDKIRIIKKKNVRSSVQNSSSVSCNRKTGGSILELMDELVACGQAMGYSLGNKAKRRWINELCHKHRINFVSLQETKAEDIDLFSIKEVWGNYSFQHVVGSSVGFSGGIACIWDPNRFILDHVSKSDYFVALMGLESRLSTKLLIISIYAPQELSEKRDLWEYLCILITRWDGETIIMGDFNEVRSEKERFGSNFNQHGANAFNHFIASNSLIDPPMDGYAFTWSHKSASKMSKLDRFLFSEGLLETFPHLSAMCLDKHLSDHRPILLRETSLDYGPSPFRFFHSWFSIEGFDSFVENAWKSLEWGRMKSHDKKSKILKNLIDLDKLIDQGKSSKEVLSNRTILLNDLQEINNQCASELAQKSKVRWSIEGDENSKYFHGVINKRRSQLAIRGILVDGDWISDPAVVKREFFKHFQNQFSPSQSSRVQFDFAFPTRLTSEPGSQMLWIHSYWAFMIQCFLHAVKTFFLDGLFPRGCNSSFIALIPKILDAKLVKDFRPISLIGSIYKIITKILANRLCLVLPHLISDVQSAFVSDRQILDGPFIINDIISWCKQNRFKGMLFKVDFAKAFDSVKWDPIWCKWIKGCLNNARGSVLVNGSPTSEFQFFKGLKQGDPLSPFLFILVMETLHLSFMRICNAGLYKGISISNSLVISHLFYADDVVFLGEWNDRNVRSLLNVLKCFYLASGLKININKSKIMGMGVPSGNVDLAANLVGCSILHTPFNYLGVKVGSNMNRICEWDDIISKVSSRLSKWKLKTLSIGGRLTLLKSVLSSIPLYHMSIYKAPLGVLNKLEVIRRNFFNGHDGSIRKATWFNWDKALASKKNGGLGVQFFAQNRALLFKWVWRFYTDKSSLWSSFIKAMHGSHGAIGDSSQFHNRSTWRDILNACQSLKAQAFKDQYGRLFALEDSKLISVASKLGHPSLFYSFRRQPRGGVEQESFNLLSSKVQSVILPRTEDRWSWSLDGAGMFSVKSTRVFIDDRILPVSTVPASM